VKAGRAAKEPPRVGETRELVVCDEVTRTGIVQYAGASGDFSVLHTDEPAARAAGHPGIMAHGMMTMAVSSRVVTAWFGTGAIRSLDARFTAPVWPGDRLVGTATVAAVETAGASALVRLALRTTNQNGQVVLTGEATATVDTYSNQE
jgi:acyl dehydratase